MQEPINVSYFRYRPADHVSPIEEEALGSSYLVFVLSGSLTYSVNGAPVTARAGEALYMPAGTVRARERSDIPAKYYSMLFSGGDPADTERIRGRFNFSDVPGIMWCVSMIDRSYAERYYESDPAPERRIGHLFALLLDFCAEASSGAGHNRYVDAIIAYIRENYKSKLKISDIADSVHLNSAYCSTIFRRSTGITIGEFITKFRLNIACEELSGGATVREAGEAVGFSDPYNFSKWFRQNAGMPPSDYRLRSGGASRKP